MGCCGDASKIKNQAKYSIAGGLSSLVMQKHF
jgi:hypothetical protein